MRRELILALALLSAAPLARAGGDLVVRAGRAFDGTRFVDAPVTLTCRDGKLVAGSPAAGTMVLDGTGLVVMPGLIDMRSGAAERSSGANEEDSETTPAWRALDAADPQALGFSRALDMGVTTVVVAPGARAVIGGIASAVKTDDRPLSQRVARADAALVITLGFEPALGNRTARFQQPWGLTFRRPGNRMGVVSEIRRSFLAAREGAKGDGPDVLRRVLAGDLPCWFVARTETDVRTALLMGGELGTKPVLLEPWEAHRMAPAVAEQAAGAVVGPEYELPRTLMETIEGQDARAASPAILREAGARVALGTGLDDDPGMLRDRALLAVRNGLGREDALAAITSVPAALLGLSSRLGTLKTGGDADLVLLDGDPLAPTTRVVGVIVDGRLVRRFAGCPAPSLPAETSR